MGAMRSLVFASVFESDGDMIRGLIGGVEWWLWFGRWELLGMLVHCEAEPRTD